MFGRTLAAAALGVLLFHATLLHAEERPLNELVTVLKEGGYEDRADAAKALMRMGKDATPAIPALLDTAANDSIFLVRRAAVDALGAIGPQTEEVVPALSRLLRESNSWQVRAGTAAALRKMGLKAKAALPALREAAKEANKQVSSEASQALLQIERLNRLADAKDGDPDTRLRAVIALGQHDATEKDVLPVLIERSRDEDARVRCAAVIALGQHDARDKEVLPVFIERSRDKDALVRRAAVIALGQHGATEKDIPPVLTERLRDEDAEVRRAAATALGRFGPAAGSATPELAAILVTVLKEGGYEDRADAAKALMRMGKDATPAIPALLDTAANDSIFLVRRAAVDALGAIGPQTEEVVPALSRLLRESNSWQVRAGTAAALRKMGLKAKAALPALREAAKEANKQVSSEASQALLQIERLNRLADAKDGDPDTRLRAVIALGQHDATEKDVLPVLIERSRDEDARVRCAAVIALGQHDARDKEVLPVFIERSRDKDALVRRAAVIALGQHDATEKDVLPVLTERLRDEDAEVRRAAATALGRFGLAAESAAPDLAAILLKEKDADVHAAFASALHAVSPPLAEKYLHSGELAQGEQALEAALAADPKDDQVRFGLGVLQFIRGVERLGQSLHKYGAKSQDSNIPFLRLPVPNNPDPATISYTAFRRLLDDFRRDLSTAEETLAGVGDDEVKLRLRLAAIRLDLAGDGKPNDKFIDILKKVMQRQNFDFLKSNPEFLVCFDRGDVAWLRAYCRLLMGMLDFYLAFDTEDLFDQSADKLFAKPKNPFRGKEAERQQKMVDAGKAIVVKEPARLGRCRKNLIKVAELNRETWQYIRAETDDDHEWLPNPRQKGVLGLPVRDGMIDAWLAMTAELEALLDGKRSFLKSWNFDKNGKGLNLKTLLDDPPEKFVLDDKFPQSLPDKYWSDEKEVNLNLLVRVFQLFGDPTAVGYAAWFN